MIAKNLEKLSNALSTAGIWISAGLLVYMVIHVIIEIVLRSFFDASTYSLDEFVGYAIGAMTFLSLAHTFREKKHIRVNILTGALRGWWRVAAELVAIAFTFAITAFLARYIWRTLARDWSRGTVSPTLAETPIWIIDAAFFIGLSLFLLQLLVSAVNTITSGVDRPPEQAAE